MEVQGDGRPPLPGRLCVPPHNAFFFFRAAVDGQSGIPESLSFLYAFATALSPLRLRGRPLPFASAFSPSSSVEESSALAST